MDLGGWPHPVTLASVPTRAAVRPLVVTLLALAAVALPPPANARDREPEKDTTSVATSGDVIVHGVDRGKLAARFRGVDQKLLDGDAAAAGTELADILLGDLDLLIEERQGVYVRAAEAATLRVAKLPPEGLAAYRQIVDPLAEAALSDAIAARDVRALGRAVQSMALSTHGTRLGVSLADLRLASGDLAAAAQALEDVLLRWPREDGAAPGGPARAAGGVEHAAVIARLAAVLASLGDVAGVHAVADRMGTAQLAATLADGGTLGSAIERASAHAARVRVARGFGAAPTGPDGAVELLAEMRYREDPDEIEPGRELFERPLALVSTIDAETPLLIKRRNARTSSALEALAPPKADAPRDENGDPPKLRVAWRWPAARELLLRGPASPHDVFAATPVGDGGDLIVFPWPADDRTGTARRRQRSDPGSARNSLILLRIDDRPHTADERGSKEAKRDDADEVLERLSFCARPIVAPGPRRPGDEPMVFACLVGRSVTGNATELHIACFAVTRDAEGPKLRLRWRRHLLDGSSVAAPARSYDIQSEEERPLVVPSTPAIRNGRLYVASGSGAVACLDAATGAPLWLETYPRRGEATRAQLLPAQPTSWHTVPVLVDGPRILVAPRDADGYGTYAPMPGAARSTLLSWTPVRDLGTVNEAGSLFHYLLADELVSARDGWLHFTGPVPAQGLPSLAPTETPLVAYRDRPARPGEGPRSLVRAQIPELHPAGRPAEIDGGILIGTPKGIYRVNHSSFDATPAVLFRQAPTPGGPDRIGSLIPAGGWLWSVTPSRVVLFRAR